MNRMSWSTVPCHCLENFCLLASDSRHSFLKYYTRIMSMLKCFFCVDQDKFHHFNNLELDYVQVSYYRRTEIFIQD